jgi:4-methylaminobutanoate oxidase (formaldehyde-forming)
MLPVMRDPDGFIYYKEEVGGLVMGGFEPMAKPWRVDPIGSFRSCATLKIRLSVTSSCIPTGMHRTRRLSAKRLL